jgi:hypothetical protein
MRKTHCSRQQRLKQGYCIKQQRWKTFQRVYRLAEVETRRTTAALPALHKHRVNMNEKEKIDQISVHR